MYCRSLLIIIIIIIMIIIIIIIILIIIIIGIICSVKHLFSILLNLNSVTNSFNFVYFVYANRIPILYFSKFINICL